MQVEELFLQFAKKASSFNSWLEDAEEDLTDPVRCNSLEEIRVRKERREREGGEGEEGEEKGRKEREKRREGRKGGGEREGKSLLLLCVYVESPRGTHSVPGVSGAGEI